MHVPLVVTARPPPNIALITDAHDLSGVGASTEPWLQRHEVAQAMRPVVKGKTAVRAYVGTFPCALWTDPGAVVGDLWVWTGPQHADGPLFYCGW
jgi:hypothetical protein